MGTNTKRPGCGSGATGGRATGSTTGNTKVRLKRGRARDTCGTPECRPIYTYGSKPEAPFVDAY